MVNVSNNPQHFFQSDRSIEHEKKLATKRLNKNGDPIALSSKIISSHYVAEQQLLFCGLSNGSIEIVNLGNWKRMKNNFISSSPISSIVYSSKESLLMCGSWDKKIRIFKCNNLEFLLLYVLEEHSDYVQSLVYCEKTNFLFSGCFSGKLFIWNLKGKPILQHSVQLHRRSIEQIIEIPNSNCIATASSDTMVKLFDYSRESIKFELAGHLTNVSCLCCNGCSENLKLFTGSADKFVIEWDIDELENGQSFNSEPIDRKGNLVGQSDIGEWVTSISVGDKFIFAGCESGKICLLDGKDLEILNSFDGHYDRITGLFVDGSLLYSVSLDGTIRRWNHSVAASHQIQIISKDEEAELDALLSD